MFFSLFIQIRLEHTNILITYRLVLNIWRQSGVLGVCHGLSSYKLVYVSIPKSEDN